MNRGYVAGQTKRWSFTCLVLLMWLYELSFPHTINYYLPLVSPVSNLRVEISKVLMMSMK